MNVSPLERASAKNEMSHSPIDDKKFAILRRVPSVVMHYGVPLLAVAAIAILRVLFWEVMGHDYEYLLFWPMVIFAAAYSGFWPGVWTTMLSLLAVIVIFYWPLTTVSFGPSAGFLVFLAVGTLCCSLIQRAADSQRNRFANAYHRSLIEASLDPLVTIGPDGKIMDANAATEAVTGKSRVELLGTDFGNYFTDPDRARAGYQQVFDQGLVRDYPLDIRHVNGHVTPVLYNASTYRDEMDKVIGVFAAARDISERKRAEADILTLNAHLRQHAAELEVALAESEEFAYAAAHNLRSPLRGIDGFCQALLEDDGERLSQEGRQHLERVRQAAQTMAGLIEALLKLSRISRLEMNRQTTDLSAMARSIADRLRKREPERVVGFEIPNGVVADSDAPLIRIVLEELLGNAWRFTASVPRASIEFGKVPQPDGALAYFVRDDGVGFDMSYADKLFVPFQHLHGPDEFPGTGIGLATVQRIVRRHGGRVWAEGAVGRGATFYFTLSPLGGE